MKVKEIIAAEMDQRQQQKEADELMARLERDRASESQVEPWIESFQRGALNTDMDSATAAARILNNRGYFKMPCPSAWIFSYMGERVEIPSRIREFLKDLGKHFDLELEIGAIITTNWADIDYPRDVVHGLYVKVKY